jgi:hypothetical protein
MSEFVFEVNISCEAFGISEDIELIVDYEYYPPERGSRECGVPMDPDIEEEWSINSIKPNDSVPSLNALSVADNLYSCGDIDEIIKRIKKDAEL